MHAYHGIALKPYTFTAPTPAYCTLRVNRHLQVWLAEGRDHSSTERGTDGSEGSLWGRPQREWLERTLKKSDATWKILVSLTPMIGPDHWDKDVNLAGFRVEFEAFLTWVMENRISGFTLVSGDHHWHYHSVHSGGVEVFSTAALKDGNTRHGVAPPEDHHGSHPEAKIRQHSLTVEPCGGFVHARACGGFVHARIEPGPNGAKLIIEHRDATGKVMHSVARTTA